MVHVIICQTKWPWPVCVLINTCNLFVAKIIEYNGEIVFDKSKPDGTYQKLLDTSKINNLGWKPLIKLKDGIIKTIKEVEKNL